MLVNQKSHKEISSSQPQELDADYSVCPLFCCFVAELTSNAYQRLYTTQRQPQGLKRDGKNRALPESLLTPNHLGSEYNRSVQGFRKPLAQDFNFQIGNASQQTIYHIFSSFHYSSVRKPNTHPIRFPVELSVLSQGQSN